MKPSSGPVKSLAVCFVHDWLTGMRGGEKVLEAMAELIPQAPIYTLFLKRENLSPILRKRAIHTSFLQNIPGITRIYRWLLPLFPLAVSLLHVKKYDVVISSSHCVAKGIKVRKDALHICYCHTPMRYLWDMSDQYLSEFPWPLRTLIKQYFKILRVWDKKTSQRVHLFLANSKNIQNKISMFYHQTAKVVYPPVEVPSEAQTNPGRFFLIVSALVPYKRIDLAVEAFNRLKLPLKIVGDGPLRKRLERLVQWKEIEFEGWLKPEDLQSRYENAKALIFPGEEDFGIVPVEAQMYGKPVIAYGSGGVIESVLAANDGGEKRPPRQSTGLFFYRADAQALCETVEMFQKLSFDPVFIRSQAKRFSRDRFQREIFEIFRSAFPLETTSHRVAEAGHTTAHRSH